MALDTTIPRSRRTLLAGGFGGLLAVAVQALRPLSARAEGETIHVGDNHFTATTATWLKNTTSDNDVFRAQTTKAGRGVYGISKTGAGVEGKSDGDVAGVLGRNASGPGVEGTSAGTRPGVLGRNFADGLGGFGVEGRSVGLRAGVIGKNLSGHGVGVEGASIGSLAGVFGRNSAGGAGVRGESNSGIGVKGTSHSDDAGVHGFSPLGPGVSGGSIGGPGILGTSDTGQGVLAQSAQGRGGVFGSPVAQVRLLPAAAATHPADGSKGDLFVDTSGRLWFCKGNANWVQLA